MSIDVSTIDYKEPNASAQFENSLKLSGFAIIKPPLGPLRDLWVVEVTKSAKGTGLGYA